MNNLLLKKIADYFRNLFLGVSLQEQVIFSRHLAIMIKSGMPLLDSLVMLKKQTRSKSLAKILDKLAADISNGQFLSKSLEQFRSIFGNLFIDILRVGEASGILSENLNYLADELRKKQELRRKVVGAMIYPIVILAATFGVSGLLTVFIFPKILPVFQSLNVRLPVTTRFLITLSNFLINYGFFIIIGLIGFILILWILIKIPSIKFFYHFLLLGTPIVGRIVKAVNLANFSRTLGLTLKSGVHAVQAISITADTLSNSVYRRELKSIAEELTRGEAIAKHLFRRPRIFPPMVAQMIAVGENTGNLSETFLYLSEFYEGEVSDFTKNLSNILEPILMVTMGIVVGFVAISIITPIYEVTQNLRR